MHVLKLALRPWRISPLSQALSAAAVGFLVMMCGFLVWMHQGLRTVVSHLQAEQVITAYVDPALEAREAPRVLDEIKLKLGAAPMANPELFEAKFVDTEQFLGVLKDSYPELGRELADLGAEMNTVVPRYVSITGVLPEGAIEDVRKVPGVASAESSRDRYKQVVGAFAALGWVARLLGAGLVLALLTGLVHLARMNASLQGDATELLRLWGAGEWTLRAPGALTGLMVGALGGIFALAVWSQGGPWVIGQIRGLSPALKGIPEPGTLFGMMLLAGAVVAGFVSGAVVSAFPAAARKGR